MMQKQIMFFKTATIAMILNYLSTKLCIYTFLNYLLRLITLKTYHYFKVFKLLFMIYFVKFFYGNIE